MMLYSVSLVAVASRSAMAWRMEPTVSGEMLSFSISTLNAKNRAVSSEISILINEGVIKDTVMGQKHILQ